MRVTTLPINNVTTQSITCAQSPSLLNTRLLGATSGAERAGPSTLRHPPSSHATAGPHSPYRNAIKVLLIYWRGARRRGAGGNLCNRIRWALITQLWPQTTTLIRPSDPSWGVEVDQRLRWDQNTDTRAGSGDDNGKLWVNRRNQQILI